MLLRASWAANTTTCASASAALMRPWARVLRRWPRSGRRTGRRCWLARGRRLAGLKQGEKADADPSRAIELKLDDPEAWRERARVSTGMGKADQAAEFLAK